MAVGPGDRLGPYEIQSAIGAGGMGEVYRARDSRLKRDVALKILPESFATDPERLARFQREAEVLASLNHSNIAQIYGIEESSGTRALVMELVDGETLADRIARGPIPLDEALLVAKQIVEALEAAHEQGINHRDLKPANIKVTPEGHVKVLDFGLAKLAETPMGARPTSPLSMSPTITSPVMTGIGVLLGTAAYMAPEQARGKATDKRADIWAFGCVLYEMLAGRRAFDGEDAAETIGAVIHKEPAWDALPAATPPHVRNLLQRCFQKDPRQRIRDIGDVRLELQSAPHAALAQAPDAPTQRSWMAWGGWALAAASTIGLVAVLVGSRPAEQPIAPDPVQFEILAPENSTFANFIGYPIVSPDGRRVVFVARGRDGRSKIWVREIGSGELRPLPATDDALSVPFWSPDSRFIAYVAGGAVGNSAGNKLNKLDVSGGAPVTLCDLPAAYRGGTWNSGGDILIGVSLLGIWRVPDTGGAPVRVMTDGMLPAFLPDGRQFLYTRTPGNTNVAGGLSIGSLDAGANQPASKELIPDASAFIYASSKNPALGHVLFLRGTDLVAQPFDPVRLQLAGNVVQIASNILQAPNAVSFSASVTGVVTYRVAGGADDSRLMWFDREGKPDGQVGPPGRYGMVRLSIDGRTLVVDTLTTQPGVRHVWTVDVRRQTFGLLNPGPNADGAGIISPDGRIVFTSNASGDMYVRSANGAGEAELLVKSSTTKHANDWSRDGRFIVYDDHHERRRQDLYILPISGDRKPVPFLVTDADETEGAFSPDGKWIAYSSDESGRRDVYVRDFAPERTPATGAVKVPISNAGGYKPRWHPNGNELFYLALDGTMMSVPVTTASSFEPGAPKALFKTAATGFLPYDVAADGRFLVNTLSDTANQQSPITVVLNWQSRLKK
jgi:eukaryotic-like serine/threonine-protein kinase